MRKERVFKALLMGFLSMVLVIGLSLIPGYAGDRPTIEELTGGKVKPGDVITKDNVALVKDLIPDGYVHMIGKGMELVIVEPGPWHTPGYFVEVTKKNMGRAVIDEKDNLRTKEGGWWDGGSPFPEINLNDPQAGLKLLYNDVHSYEGDDFTHDETNPFYVGSDGKLERTIKMSWDRIYLTSREKLDPKPTYAEKYKDLFFKQFAYVQEPFDMKGFGNLAIRYNDSSQQDDSYAYIPAMRRVRRLASAQRFDAFVGCDCTLGDFRQLDVPTATWKYKLISIKPMLAPVHGGTWVKTKGTLEQKTLFKFTEGYKFPRVNWEVIPDVYAIECMPKDPKDCPIYIKKILYLGGTIGDMPLDPAQKTWRTLYSVGYDVSGKLLKTVWNIYWGYGNPEQPQGTEDIHYEMCYGCYDNQIDHSSPWPVNLPGRLFDVGFTPERFSIGYLQKFGK